MNPKRGILGAVVALTAASSCLFSTTPPERSSGSGTPSDPNAVIVTGLVQLLDLTDHHIQNRPGWLVRVDWLADLGQDGMLDVVQRDFVRSDRSGTFTAQSSHRDLVALEVKALRCDADLEGLDCCVENPPCNPAVCNVWTTPRRVNIHPGLQVQQNVVVGCIHVP